MSETTELSIRTIFSSDSYIIPIYQRNYAWGEPEITQLIQDAIDCFDAKKDYYIGTLVVYERKQSGGFDVVDGQQRLTTLSIILSLIKKKYPWDKELNLKFECRDNSLETLQYLFDDGENTVGKDCNVAIIQGYDTVKKALNNISDESIEDFCNYFLDKVKILRVLVPEDTDLNHYFEIMNSRGEQLEQHEILKAQMLDILDKCDRDAFSAIWEACSNMEKYVQFEFDVGLRDEIFGDGRDGKKWNNLSDMPKVYKSLTPNNTEKKQREPSTHTIDNLLKPDAEPFYIKTVGNEENPERFNTIINFANFLLHILKIQMPKEQNIKLDDKRLIEFFEPYLKKDTECENKNKEFVKRFGYNLLKVKFLFDKYIIKREFSEGVRCWSLKRLECYDQGSYNYVDTFGKTNNVDEETNKETNREILMLLSMFHVSAPTLVYKYWLNAALKYVFENSEKPDFSAQTYKEYLEALARAFLFDRFLAKEPKDYFEIIYTNNDCSKNTDIMIEKLDIEKLDKGTSVENFIFNYLDYLLWQNYKTEEKTFFRGRFNGNNEISFTDKAKDILTLEYTFKSSVEHYYPQHPINVEDSIALTDDEKKQNKPDCLNNFGNLCLLSSSKNSLLSNYMPNNKKEHYKGKGATMDSIKQRIMMEYEHWDEKAIEEHGKKMKELLGIHYL
jgi:hypothetical protein